MVSYTNPSEIYTTHPLLKTPWISLIVSSAHTYPCEIVLKGIVRWEMDFKKANFSAKINVKGNRPV